MVEARKIDLNCVCRVCSTELNGEGISIFSKECLEKDVALKIERYLCFTVLETDSLSKIVCQACLKKLDNIDTFAKMSLEMQEKFKLLLDAQETTKPKIKIKSLEAINMEIAEVKEERPEEVAVEGEEQKEEELQSVEPDFEMSIDVAVEEVGEEQDEVPLMLRITKTESVVGEDSSPPPLVNGKDETGPQKKRTTGEEGNETDTSDSDRLVIQDDVKPSASLLQSLLMKGRNKQSTEIDHDYSVSSLLTENADIKDEPADPEDEDIAEEIAEDRLNQIIKEEMESDTESDSNSSDIEITEMEVKVDPMLYFSTASQSGNDEIDLDSPDELLDEDEDEEGEEGEGEEEGDKGGDAEETDKDAAKSDTVAASNSANGKSKTRSSVSPEPHPVVMTRSQQRVNPVIASLKLGKPYKCTVCPRSFITDIGLQNHLWSHLPKAKKFAGNTGQMVHKNVDMEDSQVYSSNGVLHTASPSENPHLMKYVCPICGKKISTKGNLKVHLETHRPKGKYGCDICGRVFKTAANLFRHKDYHGGVQFPCPSCGRVYPTNSTLRAHCITHSDIRPHKCPLCSKTFKRNQDLKFHINQHTGARPYQCPYCPKAFASSGNCFSHRKRMHPVEVERDKERAAEIMG